MTSGAAEFVVDLNLGPDDLSYALTNLGVRHAVVERGELPRVAALDLDVMVLEDILVQPAPAVTAPPFDPRAWGKTIMTSGTTGRPKAIVHRHDRRWIAHELLRAHLPFVPGVNDRVLLMNAYAHGAALLARDVVRNRRVGRADRRCRCRLRRRTVRTRRLTAVFAPPTVLTKLVEGTRHKRIDGIECIFSGTATLQPALYRAATALFGEVIRVTYGKSEMFNPITVLEMDEAADYYRDLTSLDAVCLGTPAHDVEVEIRDDVGRVCATRRARRNPSAQSAHDDRPCGWTTVSMNCLEGEFHATGDLGYLDERGRLFLAGRAHDMMKTGGYKIYPEEIERVLPRGRRGGRHPVGALGRGDRRGVGSGRGSDSGRWRPRPPDLRATSSRAPA